MSFSSSGSVSFLLNSFSNEPSQSSFDDGNDSGSEEFASSLKQGFTSKNPRKLSLSTPRQESFHRKDRSTSLGSLDPVEFDETSKSENSGFTQDKHHLTASGTGITPPKPNTLQKADPYRRPTEDIPYGSAPRADKSQPKRTKQFGNETLPLQFIRHMPGLTIDRIFQGDLGKDGNRHIRSDNGKDVYVNQGRLSKGSFQDRFSLKSAQRRRADGAKAVFQALMNQLGTASAARSVLQRVAKEKGTTVNTLMAEGITVLDLVKIRHAAQKISNAKRKHEKLVDQQDSAFVSGFNHKGHKHNENRMSNAPVATKNFVSAHLRALNKRHLMEKGAPHPGLDKERAKLEKTLKYGLEARIGSTQDAKNAAVAVFDDLRRSTSPRRLVQNLFHQSAASSKLADLEYKAATEAGREWGYDDTLEIPAKAFSMAEMYLCPADRDCLREKSLSDQTLRSVLFAKALFEETLDSNDMNALNTLGSLSASLTSALSMFVPPGALAEETTLIGGAINQAVNELSGLDENTPKQQRKNEKRKWIAKLKENRNSPDSKLLLATAMRIAGVTDARKVESALQEIETHRNKLKTY
ncbi:hypothetical protein JM93_00948 [Roseibium hamelinense]|uniref:Uncharacterized protein n=1 Tax=Roseibium hamelinense TaxID=150831 RepID=A0A562TI96_9HYPH|nr:hypothetical protein [Roseibium hamelinense]MTI42745.1 hypothetical protein [Roseibium hamelinense]TWI93391.1 hypothetical protein JM93_00948 [Roseibium hamelinense]